MSLCAESSSWPAQCSSIDVHEEVSAEEDIVPLLLERVLLQEVDASHHTRRTTVSPHTDSLSDMNRLLIVTTLMPIGRIGLQLTQCL